MPTPSPFSPFPDGTESIKYQASAATRLPIIVDITSRDIEDLGDRRIDRQTAMFMCWAPRSSTGSRSGS
jgi:hypothetical protein